jgi:hypothetical protein
MSDETKPWDGRPQNPERDGWHWVQNGNGIPSCQRWHSERWTVGSDPGWTASQVAALQRVRYLGPCLLPSDHAALLAERDALRRELIRARQYDEYHPAYIAGAKAAAYSRATARAEAWKAGQEEMRERSAGAVRYYIQETDPSPALACDLMDCIRALPLPPAPQERRA